MSPSEAANILATSRNDLATSMGNVPVKHSLSEVPVFVLCGGLGTRLRGDRGPPEAMVPIGSRPILWHIMRSYAAHGFERFVLCLGTRPR